MNLLISRGRQIRILVSLLALAALGVVSNAVPASGQGGAAEPPLATSSNVRSWRTSPGARRG